MPFVNNFNAVNFINKSTQATGTPDIDAAWLNYVQGIIDTQGDGLATYSSDLEALEATVTGLGSPFTNPMFLEGLNVEWISGTQIRVTSGACYVPATSRIVSKSTNTTITPSGLAAATFYYVYAIDTSGSLSFEVVATLPALYMGSAKQKSGDSSRRYVGSFRTQNGSTAIEQFDRSGGLTYYIVDSGTAPYRVISNSNSTGSSRDLGPLGSNIVPAFCKFAWASQMWANVGVGVRIMRTPSTDLFAIASGRSATGWIPLDSNYVFGYRNESSSGLFSAEIGGYWETR